METLSEKEIVKGEPTQCGGVRIVPISRKSRRTIVSGSQAIAFWTLEPIGIQVRTASERYALNLDGSRSDELNRI